MDKRLAYDMPVESKLGTVKVKLDDTTLRDGEQTAGVVFANKEKVRIARLLDEIGVDQIEAGIPVDGRRRARRHRGDRAPRPERVGPRLEPREHRRTSRRRSTAAWTPSPSRSRPPTSTSRRS